MTAPELEVPEAPVYTTPHPVLIRVLGCHCQASREGAGDSAGTGLSVYEHCCPLLASMQIKPEEMGSGRIRKAAGCAGMQGRWEMLLFGEMDSSVLPADSHPKSSQPLVSCPPALASQWFCHSVGMAGSVCRGLPGSSDMENRGCKWFFMKIRLSPSTGLLEVLRSYQAVGLRSDFTSMQQGI